MRPRQNRKRTWVDPRQEFRDSPTRGVGSFALAPIHAGEVVEIVGGIVMIAQADWTLDQPRSCGAAARRHTITGDDWRLREVQQRYYPHFSPFLNRRIELLRA